MPTPCTEESRIKRNTDDIKELYKLANRPPVWVTFVLMLMTAITTAAVTLRLSA